MIYILGNIPVDRGLKAQIYMDGEAPLTQKAIRKLIAVLELTIDCFPCDQGVPGKELDSEIPCNDNLHVAT